MTAPKPCGTLAAYRRHLRHGEIACDDCVRANRDAKQNRGTPTPDRRKPIVHGTTAGYKQHRYRGEQPCLLCLMAERDKQRARAARRRAGGAS